MRIEETERTLQALYAQRDALTVPVRAPRTTEPGGWIVSLLLLVASVVAAVALYRTGALVAAEKATIVYGAAVAGIAYGIFSPFRQSRLSQTAFGLGLAAAYLATYGAFFLPRLKIFAAGGATMPVLIGALLVVLIAVHLRHSDVAAALAFAAIFLTPPLTVWHGTLSTVGYALGISSAGAAGALLLQAHRGWVAPSWTALIGAYSTAALFLFAGDGGLNITPDQQLRLVLVYLGLVFVVLAAAALITARTAHHRVMSESLLAFASALACYALGRWAVDHLHAPGTLRSVDAAFITTLGAFAALAAWLAPRRERLTEAFLASMLIILCWSVGTELSDAALWVAPSAACFVLAAVYARSGVVFLKVLNVVVLALTFVASLWAINWKGNLAIEEYQVVSNWLVGSCVPATLALSAAVYAHLTKPRHPLHAKRWLLEGSILDVTNAHMALLHAAAGTLILLALTVFKLGGHPDLPYALAVEAVAVVIIGYLLGTPSIRMAGVALLMAAHLVYYFFLRVPQGFMPDAAGLTYPCGLAAATLVGAVLWESHIKRVTAMPRGAYELVSAIPYLLASGLWLNLAAQHTFGLHTAAVQAAIGLGFFLAASMSGFGGFKAGALLSFAIASATLLMDLQGLPGTMPVEHAAALVLFFLSGFVWAERIVACAEGREPACARSDAGVRALLVLSAGAIGAVAAYALVDKPYLSLSLFALALALALLAALFQEPRYAWPALALFALGAGRYALYDLLNFRAAEAFWTLAAAGGALAGLFLAWRRRPVATLPPANAMPGISHDRPA